MSKQLDDDIAATNAAFADADTSAQTAQHTPNQALIYSVTILARSSKYTREGFATRILRLVDEAYPERAAAGELLAELHKAVEHFDPNGSAPGWASARAAIALARPQPQEAQR